MNFSAELVKPGCFRNIVLLIRRETPAAMADIQPFSTLNLDLIETCTAMLNIDPWILLSGCLHG